MAELDERPGAEQKPAHTLDAQRFIGGKRVAAGILHERVRHQDEIARRPATGSYPNRSKKMDLRPQSFFTPYERADEGTLQEECEHPFHGERLSDDASSEF